MRASFSATCSCRESRFFVASSNAAAVSSTFFWVSVSVAAVSVVIARAGTGKSTLANSAAVTPAPAMMRRVRLVRHVVCMLGVASMYILVCCLP